MTDTHSKHNLNPKCNENLKDIPGIGQSKGAFARGGDLADADGDNTTEGGVKNDAGPQGQVNPERNGRTDR